MLSPRALLTAHNVALSLIPQDEEDMWLSGCNYGRACDMEAQQLSRLCCPVGFCAARAPGCLAPAGSPAGGTRWGWSWLPVMESPKAAGLWGWEGEVGLGGLCLPEEKGAAGQASLGMSPPFQPAQLLLSAPSLERQEWGNGIGATQGRAVRAHSRQLAPV